MEQRRLRRVGATENALSFAQGTGGGVTALNLVYQAAEVVRGIEDRAKETEARAQTLCRSAMERLKLAELRAEAAERVQREVLVEAECKLQDASRALAQAQSLIEATEDRLTAAECRAQVAEVDAHDARRALALVEEAIRRRLLCANPEVENRLSAIA
jgi:hypothetical protein